MWLPPPGAVNRQGCTHLSLECSDDGLDNSPLNTGLKATEETQKKFPALGCLPQSRASIYQGALSPWELPKMTLDLTLLARALEELIEGVCHRLLCSPNL